MNRIDVGITKALHAYLDKYGNLKMFGLNKDGELDYNEARATDKTKEHFNISVDISHYGIYQDQGDPFPTGKKEGETLTIKRNAAGEIVSAEGIAVDETLKEIYRMAEKKRGGA